MDEIHLESIRVLRDLNQRDLKICTILVARLPIWIFRQKNANEQHPVIIF
jgi:hypothetical protein